MKNIFVLLFLCAASITLTAQTNNTTLDSLIERGIKISPELKMLHAKYNASESRIKINSNMPDPMLTLGLANLPTNSFSFTQEPMTGKIIGLSQAFPFPGKLNAISKVSEKDAEIVTKEIADAENEIKNNISQNYWELGFIRKAIQVSDESKRLLQNAAEVVKTNYTVSKASQQNMLKVELEITTLTDKIEELAGKENAITSVINSQILRDTQTYIHTDDLAEISYVNINQQSLDSLAKLNRPFLAGLRLAKDKSVFMKDVAEYDFYPNFNLSLQYSQRDKIAKTNMPLDDFFTVMVGISLPLNYGGKSTAKVEEAESMQDMYEEQYQYSIQLLNGSFGSSVAKLNSLKERIKLVEEAMLPQAQQTYAASLSSYQVNQVDFINVIDAQNKLYQVETNLYRLKSDYMKQVNELEFLTGSSID